MLEDMNVNNSLALYRGIRPQGFHDTRRVRTLDANWEHLQSHKRVRAQGMFFLMDKFHDYRIFMDRMRPYMETDNNVHVRRIIAKVYKEMVDEQMAYVEEQMEII